MQFPDSDSWHLEKNNKTHDRFNKYLKKWYCPLLQKGNEGHPSKDVEKTLFNQIGSCEYLAIPIKPKQINNNNKKPKTRKYPDPITYCSLVINVLYFCMNHHKESWC